MRIQLQKNNNEKINKNNNNISKMSAVEIDYCSNKNQERNLSVNISVSIAGRWQFGLQIFEKTCFRDMARL